MDDNIESLLDDIYEAAVTPALWNKVARKIKDLCPASEVEFMLYDKLTSKVPWSFNTFEGLVKREYEAYYRDINSLWPIMKDLKPGKASDTDFYDAINRVRDTEFYADFMENANFGFVQGTNLAFDARTIGACVIGYPEKINRKHTQSGHDLIEALIPHLQRSFQLSRSYGQKHNLGGKSYQERVDAFKNPAFILGEDGVVDYMNSAAENALVSVRGVSTNFANKLYLCNDTDNEEFEKLITEASSLKEVDGRTGKRGSKGYMTFRSKMEKGVNILSLIPVRGTCYDDSSLLKIYAKDSGRKLLVVLQYDSDNIEKMGFLLERYYDLTPTENKIALALMQGISVKQYAENFNAKPATVRKHVGKIFKKTKTHHQGELISLLRDYKQVFYLER